ncbi:sugar ABC transporter substrate-binding protein [Roseovarius atlanticus]|uniref:sugar ABC transporter substrate-binding protein n=1 Tax=Roseovarius atlanticus TaxID=1641875 RepID=UPI001C965BE1|nr:sugar ABC transporter substrate-binding protein [Roseovarius atlanticus]MBY5989132.1 ABC transporter substrate-binding protein [Roseovarius atlanticus]MBY6124524.1 ABC transporter substrate-binding protein [Roseovarius atlanticus]MBY6149019.1 ABC transporter substrate-binding protein [Roseovarius atlanticus]
MNFKRLTHPAVKTIAAALLSLGLSSPAQADEKFKVFLSMSYIGNDWQAESANMIKAMAASKSMRDKIDFKVQVAGPNAQRQIQQINAMVQAGADAIIVYAISPTALNQVIRSACDKGVVIFTYDSPVTEPCAYQITVKQELIGPQTAEWLAKQLNYKGDIIFVHGVPGTSPGDIRSNLAKETFAKYPDINIVAEAVGMWSQSIARQELSKILATRPWDTIDGLWMQVGCYTAASMQEEAGIPDDQKKPCVGEGSNGHRLQMLPAGTEVDGTTATYRPMGYPSISYASPTVEGALALKMAVEKLEGADIPHMNYFPLPLLTNKDIKLCKEGTWQELSEGCNVFSPTIVTNPGWFSSIYSADTPGLGLNAALIGEPED